MNPIDKNFSLSSIDPNDNGGFDDKAKAEAEAARDLETLYDLHYTMYAENRRSLLVVLQGMDASGKDGAIRHLAAVLNPQGVHVHSFKVPAGEETEHDFLWRVHRVAPRQGEAAIFNRSHYEEVLVVKVHPEILLKRNLPPEAPTGKDLFKQRYRQINDFERMLAENGTVIVKLMLHISPEEQLERIEKRIKDPERQWKYAESDMEERKRWDDYMDAYQSMLRNTSTDHAPWYVIPSDRKWYRNYLIGKILIETLENLKMQFPKLNERIGD